MQSQWNPSQEFKVLVLLSMLRPVILTLIVFIILIATPALARAQKDVCHVYVVDVAKAQAAWDRDDKNAMAAAQVVFPNFEPKIGEEELTTKTYRFPKSKFVITASVFYTDESMGTGTVADSMLVAILVSTKPHQNAITANGNSVAEVTYVNNQFAVRAKKYTRVNGRFYVVGIECRSEASTP